MTDIVTAASALVVLATLAALLHALVRRHLDKEES